MSVRIVRDRRTAHRQRSLWNWVDLIWERWLNLVNSRSHLLGWATLNFSFIVVLFLIYKFSSFKSIIVLSLFLIHFEMSLRVKRSRRALHKPIITLTQTFTILHEAIFGGLKFLLKLIFQVQSARSAYSSSILLENRWAVISKTIRSHSTFKLAYVLISAIVFVWKNPVYLYFSMRFLTTHTIFTNVWLGAMLTRSNTICLRNGPIWVIWPFLAHRFVLGVHKMWGIT